MKTFKETVDGKTPTLVVFIHSGHDGEADLNLLLEQLRDKYDGRANVLRVDASFDKHIAKDFRLSTTPTYVLMKEGQELMRESGTKTLAELSELIERGM